MACTGIEYCKLAIVETKAPRGRGGRPAGGRLARPRHRHHHQHQRLPERLRPHPGRRHRPQGPAGAGARTASMVEGFQVHLGGGLAMAAGPDRRLRPQAARPEDHRRRAARRTSSGWPAATWPAATDGEIVRQLGACGPTRRQLQMSRGLRAARVSVLLPVLRRARTCARTRTAHGAWECRECTRVFSVKLTRSASRA